ncbi:MAG: hypothetical protein WCX61_00230 [Candidatus Peribacteraceae bacterium]|jgi:xanthine/uracil permease
MIHTLFVIIGLGADSAYAGAFDEYCSILHSGCGSGSSFLEELFSRLGNFFAPLVAGAAVAVIIYGAIRLITSAGNDQGKEEAKKIITTALTGLILALAAEAIIIYINNFIWS